MGLYNPILGDIPQPQKNSTEVAFITKPTNYGATVTTPKVNHLFAETLETFNSQTDSYTTTKPIVLTRLVIQGTAKGTTTATENCTIDIYLDNIKLLSLNIWIQREATYVQTKEYSYDIPLENVLIEKGTIFKMISDRVSGDGGFWFNCSIIGYDYVTY